LRCGVRRDDLDRGDEAIAALGQRLHKTRVLGVVAQRLARMLCPSCKRRTIIPAKVLRENGYRARVELEAYEPVGCRRCGGSGYRGRVGLYEVMKITPEIQALTLERSASEALRDVAVSQGMTRLRDDGLQKVRQGRTSMAEIARVIGTN